MYNSITVVVSDPGDEQEGTSIIKVLPTYEIC
jgi:hypothetical protein